MNIQYPSIKQQQLRKWKGFSVRSKSKGIKATVASKMTPYASAALSNIFKAPLSQPGVRDVPRKMVTDWHHLARPAGDRLLSVWANTGCSHPSPADGTTHPHDGGLGVGTQSPSHHPQILQSRNASYIFCENCENWRKRQFLWMTRQRSAVYFSLS